MLMIDFDGLFGDGSVDEVGRVTYVAIGGWFKNIFHHFKGVSFLNYIVVDGLVPTEWK